MILWINSLNQYGYIQIAYKHLIYFRYFFYLIFFYKVRFCFATGVVPEQTQQRAAHEATDAHGDAPLQLRGGPRPAPGLRGPLPLPRLWGLPPATVPLLPPRTATAARLQ